MAVQPIGKFKFSFADLALEAPRLQVLAPATTDSPPQAATLPARIRPRWLPRLLPVFSALEPLRVEVAGEAASPFAARLLRALAAIYAAAGAESGVKVLAWKDGFGVGGHALDRLPACAHAVLVAAELEPGSLEVAGRRLRELPPGQGWLVLHGDLRRLDAALGLPALAGELAPGHLVRLPLLGPADLRALGRGVEPVMARRRCGRRLWRLAVGVTRAYLGLPT
ncbi:MAG TPA: hypothetical protein VF160_13640 [Candidatus Dormibacteraeota bacterium]